MNLKISKETSLILIVTWLLFSSIFIASVYLLFEKPPINLLILKDLFLVLGLGLIINNFKKVKVNIFNTSLFVFFVFLFITSFFSDALLFGKLASIRQIIIPFILILIGLNAGLNEEQFLGYKKNLIKLVLIITIFGFFELFFEIWHTFDLTNYFKSKNIPVYGLDNLNFYNYPVFFIEPIFDGIKRMSSTLLDPINFGHVLTFILSLLIFDKSLNLSRNLKNLLILLFSVALLLTFSKGAILQIFLVFLFTFKRISVGIKLVILSFLVYLLIFISNFHDGIKIHLQGIKNAIESITFFGHGLAKTGNQASLFSEKSIEIGDTFIGSILGQLGILGLLLWILPFYILVKKNSYDLLSILIIAQLLIAIISENSFNLLSVSLLCITLGINLKQSYGNE
jgi:hypothetical protein